MLQNHIINDNRLENSFFGFVLISADKVLKCCFVLFLEEFTEANGHMYV